jgi:hypothetical protein
VVHWWQNCFHYAGVGLDWRYEGIILGYLNLFEATGEERWFEKAKRAADDIVNGQLPNGNFRQSSFELNPYPGGTPHEACCDIALLRLAEVMIRCNRPNWDGYVNSASANIFNFYVDRLWDEAKHTCYDDPSKEFIVPNKIGSLAEALILLSELTDEIPLIDSYALPCLNLILAHQVRGGRLDGAISQYSWRGRPTPRFFPFYTARCVPGLIAGYKQTGQYRYIEAAERAVGFIVRFRCDDGSFPQVIYENGKINRFPQWIAATGDILRAMQMVPLGRQDIQVAPTLRWLVERQDVNGTFPTAYGFGSQVSQRCPDTLPDFRDILPVCGWADKSFRFLTGLMLGSQVGANPELNGFQADLESPVRKECLLGKRRVTYSEGPTTMELRDRDEILFHWKKKTAWAEVSDVMPFGK